MGKKLTALCILGLFVVATVFIGLYISQTQTNLQTKQTTSLPPLFINAPDQTSFIDYVYYINLDTRTDRRYLIESQLNRMGLTFTRIPGVKDKFGALGCSKAHANALETAQMDCLAHPSWKHILIVEDDAFFHCNKDQFHTQLNKFKRLHWNWDILMLAGVAKDYQQTDVDFVLRIYDAQTTAAYVVNTSYLPTLLNNIQEGIGFLNGANVPIHDYCLDIYWKSLQKQDKWFALYPFLVHQRDDFSDIEQRDVSYVDKHPLALPTTVPIEYIVCVKTCKPRLCKNDAQLDQLDTICEKGNIRYFIYYGNPEQENWIKCENHIITLKCKDDYLNLCHKVGLMFRFLMDYIHTNALCSNLKGIFFTDDDIELHPFPFYGFLETNHIHDYWGKTATYPKDKNLSNHLIDKANESKHFHEYLLANYPDLLKYPIQVPKITFCAGGGFFLSQKALRAVVLEDEHFVPFPSNASDLSYHFEKNCFVDLHVFDDTEVAIALSKHNILATPILNLDTIASW
jgi:GR25 family glycosyltransferase involved in LPS biosynthesis